MSNDRNLNRMKRDELIAIATEAINKSIQVQKTFSECEENIKSINAIHANINQYQQLVTNLEDINNRFDYEATKAQLDNISKMHGELETLYKTVFDPENGLDAQFQKLHERLNDYVTEANKAKNKITGDENSKGYEKEAEEASGKIEGFFKSGEEYISELLEDKEDKKSIKTLIEISKKDIEDIQGAITTYHEDLLIGKEADNKSKAKVSLKNQISAYKAALEDLKAKMYNLLPEYVSATQAYSYYNAKSYHGPTKSVTSENSENRKWYAKAFLSVLDLSRYLKPIFFYFVFIAPILLLIAIFTPIFLGISIFELIDNQPIAPPTGLGDYFLLSLIFRIAIAAPLGFISFFGYKSIARSRKLYEEYDHKQRVMETYFGFKNEAEQLSELDGNNLEHINKLMSIVLATVADKPSSIRNPEDKSDIGNQIPQNIANDVGATKVNQSKTIKPKTAEPKISEDRSAES